MVYRRLHLTMMDTKPLAPSAIDWSMFHYYYLCLYGVVMINAMNSNDDGGRWVNEICHKPNRFQSMPATLMSDHLVIVDDAVDDDDVTLYLFAVD